MIDNSTQRPPIRPKNRDPHTATFSITGEVVNVSDVVFVQNESIGREYRYQHIVVSYTPTGHNRTREAFISLARRAVESVRVGDCVTIEFRIEASKNKFGAYRNTLSALRVHNHTTNEIFLK